MTLKIISKFQIKQNKPMFLKGKFDSSIDEQLGDFATKLNYSLERNLISGLLNHLSKLYILDRMHLNERSLKKVS